MYNRSNNPFADLYVDSDDEFEKPEVHPTATLIKFRFSHWYYGKLTSYEINKIKEEMIKCKTNRDKYRSLVSDELTNLYNLRREEKKLCSNSKECSDELYAHIKICDSTYKCTINYVAYECQFKENGRCSHYYKIEHLDQDIGYIEESLDDYQDKCIDLEIMYERALAVKEDRLEEYQRQLDDDWDDYNYEVSMRI
jgi:hypothetical protein